MNEDKQWESVTANDETADGTFLYGVVTTGIYCRPSCPSRLPRRENVRFFATSTEAEQSGFRACLRCDPTGTGARGRRGETVAMACRMIEDAAYPPDLATLAAAVGMSRYHFHRLFKAVTGITPKAYADAERADRVRIALLDRAPVTEAIYGAGFGSNGRFYASSNERLGMTPSRFRDGARGLEIRFAVGECSLGPILVAASARGICAIELGDDPETLVLELQGRFHAAQLIGGDPSFEAVVAQVVALVEDPTIAADLPLDVRGTAFQERVWRALRQVPPGATVSYAELAQRIGAPSAVRAVASACAANHLAVAIPCHRVVRTDGTISGYRWGVERKQVLLDREAPNRPVGAH